MNTFKTKSGLWLWLATLFLSALVVSSCLRRRPINYGLDDAQTLRITLGTEPPSLDWSKSTDTTSALLQDNIMEGLVSYNFDDPDLSLMPELALSWEPSNQAQVWTFKLRQGVMWTDGVEFTAQQMVDGWERLLNPNTAAEYAYFLYGVKNARAYNEGKLKDFSKVGIKAVDKYTLMVELVGPQSYFPYLLTHHCTYPVRKDLIKKFGDAWTEPENLQTLGAFTLKIWEHDKAVVLERNPQYFGTRAKVKNVLAYIITETSTALNLFNAGRLDLQVGLPSEELAVLRKRPEYRQAPVLTIYYYGLNTQKKPFDDARVRRAISHAIDRKEVTQLLGGGERPITGWIPPGMFGHEPDIGLSFDVDKAKQLMTEAGFTKPGQFPKISITFNTNENHQRIAENVQAQLKRNLGINVELANEEWKVYLSRLKVDPPGMFRLGWQADFPDPDNFLNLITSYSDNNHTRWANKEYDRLIEKAASTINNDERRQLYRRAQKILVEQDVPAIPIFASVSHALVAERVKNFKLNSMGRLIFKGVELK